MFEVRKQVNDLQACISSMRDENEDPEVSFNYGNPECGSLADYVNAMAELYGEREEFVSWNNTFREYLHKSEFNIWLLVLQQPGKSGTVEYIVDFSKYNVLHEDTDRDVILRFYHYYMDTVIGKTMLGFFYKVRTCQVLSFNLTC